MNKQEYISSIEKELDNILHEYLFNNYKKQIFARRLSADFNRTYNEGHLWNRSLYLSTHASILLLEGVNERLAIRSLKESAEIYEYLSSVSESYDKQYSIILSSICYDLAGYQANALCLISKIQDYDFNALDQPDSLQLDNYILSQVKLILHKKIPYARKTLNGFVNDDIGINLFKSSMKSWYGNVLDGSENDYCKELDQAYKYYINASNLYISHLLFLLKTRFRVYQERSTWDNLLRLDSIKNSSIWKQYIRLLSNDFYDRNEIKPIDKRISRFELWTSQLRAVQSGLLDSGNNYVIQMPTSAGKTFIAELAILNSLVTNPGKKCLYVAPFRALTNEKEGELADYISKIGYSVSALTGSYEIDEFQNLMLDETDVLIATPEKMDLLLRLNPDFFNTVSLIVVDEGQILGDISSRSSLIEFLIIRLRMKIDSLKTLFISAVMPPANADEYSIWLSGQKDRVIRSLLHSDSPLEEEWEPTRKLIGSFTWDGENGRIAYKNVETENEETKVKTGAFIPAIIKKNQYALNLPDGKTKAQTSASLAYELSKGGNCLIFCSQVKDTERVGNALLSILVRQEEVKNAIPDNYVINRERESYYFARKWFGDNSYISKCLERGIGIHYGDMPESVRMAVESDYRSGYLQVLISTNTVGQGLNLPIKYVIIHSTIITQNQKVSVRDFWNIIGRAGRAGKETEGQIIFVINSYTDRISYEEYSDRSNIENAYSILFNVLDWLTSKRIDADTFEKYISILSEPYILNLLVEETTETDDQNTIERIIGNSLFAVQSSVKGIEIQPIRNSFSTIFRKAKEEIPKDLMKVYGETGFNIKSNKSINDFIDLRKDDINNIVRVDDYSSLLKLILELFDGGEIEEITSQKLDKIKLKPTNFLDIALSWIAGSDIDELYRIWNNVHTDRNFLNILIADGFYYRYSWGVTSFLTIMVHKLGIPRDSLPDGIKNLPSFVKYGLNNKTACLARSMGIKNRDIAFLLANRSNNLFGKDFIKWVANLTIEDINSFSLNPYDAKNILAVALKLSPKRFMETPELFEFYIKGIPFEEIRKSTSQLVNVGDVLVYQRDESNNFDPYAIKIFKEGNELGFVPREHSKSIAVEIDINATQYKIEVKAKEQLEAYSNILVQMKKV
jgi:superfamily II DNA/RNA helicase